MITLLLWQWTDGGGEPPAPPEPEVEELRPARPVVIPKKHRKKFEYWDKKCRPKGLQEWPWKR